MITFDPNGGDLGRSELGQVTVAEFKIILPHILNILESLHIQGDSKLPYKYAFEFNLLEEEKILEEIQFAEINMQRIAQHVKFYRCDGNPLFGLRGASGGMTTSLICYLYTDYRMR